MKNRNSMSCLTKVFLFVFCIALFWFITVVLWTGLAHAGNTGGLLACQASLTTCNTNLNTCNSNLTTCEECANIGKSGGPNCESVTNGAQPYGTLACSTSNTGCTFDTSKCTNARFVDNGDGTITDNQTGLMWEKKDQSGGVHDVGNTYSWSATGTAPDGTAFTSFLPALTTGTPNCSSDNVTTVTCSGTGPCFAGHCDWRLPEINELITIMDTSASGCGSGSPCVNPIFNSNCTPNCTATGMTSCSCTVASNYWSATTYAFIPNDVWVGVFFDGAVGIDDRPNFNYVRAVRTGP